MRVRNKNLFELIDELIVLEKENGIVFNGRGFPVFKPNMFVEKMPLQVLPYLHRKEASIERETCLCFYELDKLLYRHLTLAKLEQVAKELNKYQGFIGYDLSIFSDMLLPFQKFYILANLVIDMFFILHGNKMIPNLRGDEINGEFYFDLFKNSPIVSCGTLGCSKYKEIKNSNKKLIEDYLKEHENQKLIIYGSKLCDYPNVYHYKNFGRRYYE